MIERHVLPTRRRAPFVYIGWHRLEAERGVTWTAVGCRRNRLKLDGGTCLWNNGGRVPLAWYPREPSATVLGTNGIGTRLTRLMARTGPRICWTARRKGRCLLCHAPTLVLRTRGVYMSALVFPYVRDHLWGGRGFLTTTRNSRLPWLRLVCLAAGT